MDGAVGAPGTGRAGPRAAVGAPGGTDAPDSGPGAVAGRVSPPRPPVPTGADCASDPGAARVWALLLEARDPVSADTLASAAAVPRATAQAALLVFEQAEYVLRIPGQSGRFPYPDLWVLAGGVRQGRSVADAVRHGLLDQSPGTASAGQHLAPEWVRLVLPVAGAVPVGPVTGNPVLPRGGLRELVFGLLVEHYPAELGPAGMAKLLDGRSAGAIRNAADALCREGRVVCTDLAVRRYAALLPHAGVTGHADTAQDGV